LDLRFALAPKVHLTGVRYFNSPYQDALEIAVDQHGVDIITCSWGWDKEQSFPVLEATLRSIIEEDGKLVVFAAGNGQYAWPGSMPDVISVGGVYADVSKQLEASDYASGFVSSLYPPRQVPDVCGMCGQTPKGIYIPMPCPPGCEMDVSLGGDKFPDGDETSKKDGWVVASGTSSAAPQVAGILALLLQAAKAKGSVLTNAIAKDLLQKSARNISRGRNAFGFPATTSQPNGAVGWGLVDVTALLDLAKAQNLI
jgi:subtilisin family serine protease